MMRHSPEYENFKHDAKDFAKGAYKVGKKAAKLGREAGKEVSKLIYQSAKERWQSLSQQTQKKLLAALIATGLVGGGYFSMTRDNKKDSQQPTIEQINSGKARILEYEKLAKKTFGSKLLKTKPQDVGMLEEWNNDHTLKLAGKFPDGKTQVGKIIRCMRWEKLTDEAERKYGLPPKILLAMMAQEGLGDPTLPNISAWDKDKKRIIKSDGGLGLIHIQGVNAQDYGLKVIQVKKGKDNERTMADFALGDKIIELYNQTQDTKKLAKYDERRNPVLAVDVAARFLRNMYENHGKAAGKDAWIVALNRYSGRKWTDYAKKVIDYRTTIDAYRNGDKSQIPIFTSGVKEVVDAGLANTSKVEDLKSAINDIQVKLDEEEGGFDLYCSYFEKELDQYGFQAYQNYHPKAK